MCAVLFIELLLYFSRADMSQMTAQKTTQAKIQKIHLALGNQLFAPKLIPNFKGLKVVMIEDMGLCTYVRHHKLKIHFFLASMRHYAEELRKAGAHVTYIELDAKDSRTFEQKLSDVLKKLKATELQLFEIEDKFFEQRLQVLFKSFKLGVTLIPSPMFMTSREEFAQYIQKSKKPFMKTFYEQQRRRTGLLMSQSGEPEGGKFSFDSENRKKLPANVEVPKPHVHELNKLESEVQKQVSKIFASHPGDGSKPWLPTTRDGAEAWLKEFLKSRVQDFGEYEDALTERSDVVFHSVLTPFLNVGLLTPDQVLKETLLVHRKKKIPLNSTEGFVRQILGWREFIRGIYRHHSEKQENTNFWKHRRQMKSCWYEGTTGLPPVDAAIKKALTLGYNHHIERLMVLANVMNLAEIEPQQVHRWFMEMYIDSSDWVMGPNVYGMGLHSDGGIFATKPYICGSNYILKMSDHKKGDWCDELDGLYWQFIDKHQDFYSKNPRMSVMASAVRKMPAEKKERLFRAANTFRNRTTS